MMKQVLRFLAVIALALVAGSSHAQQNLLAGHNCDFQISDVSWPNDPVIYTDFTYYYEQSQAYHFLQTGGADGHGSGKIFVTAQANNANGSFFPCTGHPSGHSAEKFLAVNGFGGNLTQANYLYTTGAPNSSKIIQYTLQVEPNMFYDFTFWATHLSNGSHTLLPALDAKVKFRVECNNTTVLCNNQTSWEPTLHQGESYWEQSPVFRCLSDANGQLKIALYDECLWISDYGDDFGIDDASLVRENYAVNPHLFAVTGCTGSFDPIEVLPHVEFTEPAGQPNLPAVIQIRRSASSSWVDAMTPIQTYHGTAYLGNDNKVYYTPDEGYVGTDQIQYRVRKYGITSSEKNINITVISSPSNFVVSGFPQDGYWCKGDAFPMFTASCNNNGGELWNSECYWEWTESFGQPWNLLNFNNFPNSSSCHDYYVRYRAENACGFAYSDTLLLKICDDPVLNKTNITVPNTICEGGSLPDSYLSQVDVSDWKNDVGVKGWQVKHGNGSWMDIGEAVLAQGDKLRYHAQNHCGEVVTNEVTISVTAGPEFTQPTPAFDAYYCVEETLNLSSQSTPSYITNNINVSEHYWVRSVDGGNTYSIINGNPSLDLSWDGNWICYRLVCACGTVNSPAPFVLHVYGNPEFSEELAPFEAVFCAGDVLSANDLQAPAYAGAPGTSSLWQISTGTSQNNYETLNLPKTLSRADNGKWVRHYAISGCGDAPSNAVQLTVNDKATLNTMSINAPAAICLGGALPSSFSNQVHVTEWNGDEGVAGWWIKHPGGDWEELTSDTELQDGDQVKYQATNGCGSVSTNTVTLEVSEGPILQSTPAFASYFCVGDELVFPEVPGYNPNGLTVLPGSSYWAFSDEEGVSYTPIEGTPILDEEWNGRLIRYHLAYQCDGQTVYAYSPNPYSLTVYGEPSLIAPDSIPVALDTVCWGTYLSDVLPEGFSPCEDCHYDSYGWEISEAPGSMEFVRVDNPDTYLLPVTDNGCWVRFYVDGCGEPATSELMRLSVGDAPSLYPETITNLPNEVCEGTSVGSLIANGMLTEISVGNWHLFDDPNDPVDPSYERWEVNYNGQWIPLSNFEMAYNGCLIRYVAHNHCGTSEVVASSPIAVVEGPSFVAPTEQLPFEERYCVTDLLYLPPAPAYVDPYNNITDAYWASSYDGIYFSKIGVEDPVLTDNWHGRYISYVLESDCGGIVVYSTPFQLYVVGTPEVLSAVVEPTTLCEGEFLTTAEVDVDWKNGSDNGTSSWQYAPEDDPYNLQDFDPRVETLPPGINTVRYRADNGCYTPGSSELFLIEVTPLPHFTDNAPLDLPGYCEGTALTLPAAPETEGYVEGEGVWQISAGTNQNGPYLDVTNAPLTAQDEGKWLKYSVTGCNGLPISKYGEIHIIGLPYAEFEITDNLCRGQYLNPQVLNVSSNIDYVLWRYTDSQGNTVAFSPVNDPFMTLGDFYVSWAAVNSCNEDHPEYSVPKHVEVVQGPEFAAVSWPSTVSVCSGMSLSEVLSTFNIDTPLLTDPGYQPAPQLLGWYLKYQDENNFTHFDPMNMTQVITERYQGYELCYAMKGDCSNDPIYSQSFGLSVKGRPVITTMSVSDHFCSGESFPPADFQVEIDDHQSAYTSRWQRLDGGSWTDIPGQSFTIDNSYDGAQVRYVISSSDCDFELSASDPVTLHVTGTPEILNDIQASVGVCADGVLVIAEPEVAWHNTEPEIGEWQVCATENGNYGVGPFGADGVMFDMGQVAWYFNGWYLRYHVEGCNDENNSNAAKITVFESSEVQITGVSQAAVMNSFWPGVYYYYTDVDGSALNWTLTPEIWPYQDTIINGKSCCQVIVTQKGQAVLSASVGDGSCGSDSFFINATPFGVEENEAVKMELYPNPARHAVTVVSEAIQSITVYNMLGQPVKSIEGLADDSVSFSVADFPEALYLVEVHTQKGNKTLLLSVM